ncbi:hypothetical protein SASPL_150050 [Salvia splendens]|uniref:Uncharacterized protein n=1 Tax=Salvia splendens TaxID=180675 RepID=A0A8X8Z244_SALSN|nr:hypothetical protein SASPL_150050 [Salvia splendens]
MSSKVLLLVGLFLAMALLISSEVASAKELDSLMAAADTMVADTVEEVTEEAMVAVAVEEATEAMEEDTEAVEEVTEAVEEVTAVAMEGITEDETQN